MIPALYSVELVSLLSVIFGRMVIEMNAYEPLRVEYLPAGGRLTRNSGSTE
jgi:hypothetical protein